MSRAWTAWQRFWFEPESTAPLVLVRIAFGVVVIAWALSLAPDLLTFFGPHGLSPETPHSDAPLLWTLLTPFNSNAAVIVCYVALLAAAVALIAGFRARVAALVIFVALTSFERRNVYVTNSGDELLRIIALILMLAPSAVGNGVLGFAKRSPWALRLLQVQVSVLYLSAVWAKVRGDTWNDGTATSYAMRLHDMARLQLPHALSQSELLSNLLTYGTLAVELSIGVLVWNRRLRPYVLLAGVVLHLSIELTMRIGFFSWAVLVSYLAFVPPEQAELVIGRFRRGAARLAAQRRTGRESRITALWRRPPAAPRLGSRSSRMPAPVMPGEQAEDRSPRTSFTSSSRRTGRP